MGNNHTITRKGVIIHMLVAIRPEKDLGNGFIGFQPKTTSSSQSYLSSRSAKRLLQAEGEGK